MHDRETCVECGTLSPETNANLTLTSSMGWRLMREHRPDGTVVAVWRCGPCWREHKARSVSADEPTTGVRKVTAATSARPREVASSQPRPTSSLHPGSLTPPVRVNVGPAGEPLRARRS